jgi:hypothetical protein
MSAIYVLGAGASYHAGYPLASALGVPLLDEMLRSNQAAYAEYLKEHFGVPTDFEAWITTILARRDEAKNHTDRKPEYRELGTALGMLTLALAEWFRRIGDGSSAPLYADFSKRIVHEGDVVITFNYDDALERELRRVRKWDAFSHGYGFPLGRVEHECEVLLLKLHGSMNWVWNPFDGVQGGGPSFSWNGPSLGKVPVMLPRDLKFLGYDDPSGPGVYRSGAALHSMILPGRSKQFNVETSFGVEQSDFWELLWSQARKALETCSKMVICGYSLPSADQRARDLLFNTLPKDARIEVVSGQDSERIAAEFKGSQFSNVTAFGRGYFADWLAAIALR